ncbi:MAG: FAD-dependent oxidoreductase [Hyphomicrobiales bacterium]
MAVRRALQAGFDIALCLCRAHPLLGQFLDPQINQRHRDAYGGSAQNRQRLLREVIEDTRELLEGKAALALRIEVTDEDGGGIAERNALLAALAPAVDLFDVTLPDYSHEMGASRFIKEGSLEPHITHVRALTGKPVVSVGRFTSPETMLSLVKRGVLDLIGAARPSIADPFLPTKIREGRFEDIRECIGCNICYANDGLGVPIRCTQNPAMGEEWRRGWHPERVTIATVREPVLIIGAGPAGLEAAHTLGKRGVPVMLAEAARDLGGRVTREARLPGLSEWARVRDWRVQQLAKLANVEIFRESEMSAASVQETGAQHVIVATGAKWRGDGRGRNQPAAIPSFADARTLTPDAIMAGRRPKGDVVIYDDEHYYMASVLAELLAQEGCRVTFVTSAAVVGPFLNYTVEQQRTQKRLLTLGVTLITSHAVSKLVPAGAELTCLYTGKTRQIACDGFVPVTSREPDEGLWNALQGLPFTSLTRVGDCKAPGLIAHAVFDGHRAAQEFGGAEPVLRERVVIAEGRR